MILVCTLIQPLFLHLSQLVEILPTVSNLHYTVFLYHKNYLNEIK